MFIASPGPSRFDIKSAIAYLIEEEKAYRLREDAEQREMFEIVVRFNNGAKIEATFPTRQEAIGFVSREI